MRTDAEIGRLGVDAVKRKFKGHRLEDGHQGCDLVIDGIPTEVKTRQAFLQAGPTGSLVVSRKELDMVEEKGGQIILVVADREPFKVRSLFRITRKHIFDQFASSYRVSYRGAELL